MIFLLYAEMEMEMYVLHTIRDNTKFIPVKENVRLVTNKRSYFRICSSKNPLRDFPSKRYVNRDTCEKGNTNLRITIKLRVYQLLKRGFIKG